MKEASAPQKLSVESLMVAVADEFLERLNHGEQPDIEEYAGRYPEIAAFIRQMFPTLQMLRIPGPNLSTTGAAADLSKLDGCLGDFRILRELGRGGMGVVYEAEQISLRRRVALKVLPFAAALDAKQLQRFQNEAQAAAHLHHTHIVPVFGVGCERGVHYYAMQYIEGQTLAAAIAELRQYAGLEKGDPSRPLSEVVHKLVSGRWAPAKPAAGAGPATLPYLPGQASPAPAGETTPSAGRSTEPSIQNAAYFRTVASLGIQAALALEHAHQLGVVHRDIKPANLLLEWKAGAVNAPVLWITDFGLAHCQNQAGLTMTGDLVGTLRYMSPEQALGKRLLLDHRTDIYSLGVTLYELLTLEAAYNGSDREEVLRQVGFQEPRPPRQRNKAIPRELETIVLKAMEKSPEARYAAAQELADDLHRYLEDRPIRAKRPTLVQRASKWCRRHKPLVAAGVVVGLLGVLVAATILLWLAQQRTETAGRVEEALRRAGELQIQSRWPEALEAAQRAQELLKVGGGGAVLRQRVQGTLADLKMILRLDDIRQLEEPIRHREKEAVREGGFHDLQALSFLYAEAFRKYGIDVDALEAEEAAQRIRARPICAELATALDHWAHVRLIKMVGTSEESKWQHLVAVARAADREDPWRNRLREHWGRSPGDKKILLELAASLELGSQPALTLHLLGNCLGDAGAVDAAVNELWQAQQWHPDNFWIAKDLADYLQLLGQPAEALRFRTVALVLRPRSARLYSKLGNALLKQEALKQAIAAFNEGQRFVSEDTGIDIQWGNILKKKGALDETVAAFQEASRLQPDEAGIYLNWASALMDRGTWDKAIAVYDQAMATVKRVRSRQPGPSSLGALLHHAAGGRAEALLWLRRFKEAEHTYQEALEIDPSSHWSWYCDAALRLHLGDIEGYRRVCREMLARFSHTDDPKIAERVAKTCLLIPEAVSDLQPVLQLAERGVTGTQQHWGYRSFLMNQGIAEYRAGDFANAIDRLNQSLSLRPAPWYWWSRYMDATAHLFLAMAHHRLGHAEQARQEFHQGTLVMEPRNGRNGDNEPQADRYDWIRLQIARKEAERLLKG